MVAPLFLIHIDAAGAKTHIALDAESPSSIIYLPDVDAEELTVTTKSDDAHCCVRLDIEEEYCLLTVYSNEVGPTFILGDTQIEIPLSTMTRQKSFILTEAHQFATPTGRWLIEWDRSGHISNSMRPPALPSLDTVDKAEYLEPVTLDYLIDEDILLEREETSDSEEEMHEAVPVTEIQLSSPSSEKPDPPGAHNLEVLSNSIIHKSLDISHIVYQDAANRQSTHPNDQAFKGPQPLETQYNHVEADQVPPKHVSLLHSHQSCEQGVNTSTIIVRVSTPENDPRPSIDRTNIDESTNPAIANSSLQEDNSTSEITGTRKDAVQESTLIEARHEVQVADLTTVDSEVMDETTSEDESQQQRDTRIPKRHLIDIENGNEIRSKRRKPSTPSKLTSTSNQDNDPNSGPTDAESQRLEHDGSQLPRNPKSKVSFSFTEKTPFRSSSRRLSATPESSRSAYTGDFTYRKPAVIFGSTSEVSHNRKYVSVIQRLGGTIVTEINRADILCIGVGPLKKTCKFIMAVTMGKDIVTDDWVRQCYVDQKFPDPTAFLPNDIGHERAWKFKLVEAIERGKKNLRLLHGFYVHLTTQLRKDLGNLTKEIKQIAIALGANVRASLPKENSKHQILVVRSSKNVDPELIKIDRLGYKVYNQDILTMAALRGKLEINSTEFMIDVPIKEEKQNSTQ